MLIKFSKYGSSAKMKSAQSKANSSPVKLDWNLIFEELEHK